jgi:hypothetical protein
MVILGGGVTYKKRCAAPKGRSTKRRIEVESLDPEKKREGMQERESTNDSRLMTRAMLH